MILIAAATRCFATRCLLVLQGPPGGAVDILVLAALQRPEEGDKAEEPEEEGDRDEEDERGQAAISSRSVRGAFTAPGARAAV